MPQVGPSLPTVSGEFDIGGGIWNDSANIQGNDGIYTIYTLGAGEYTNQLYGLGYEFSVPGTATINGVEFEYSRYAIESGGADIQAVAQLIVDNSAQGSTFGDLDISSTETVVIFGGPTELWNLGGVLTPAKVNQSDFGACIFMLDNASLGFADLGIDYYNVTVYYTEAGGTPDEPAIISHTQGRRW